MPEKLHPNVEKVAAVLREHGATGEIVVFEEATPTAATAAARLGCEVGAIANSLVFDADGEPLLVLTSGAHRVDTALVARTVGAAKVRRASPDFVRAATGQVIGGVAPVGHPAPLRTLVDTWLDRYETVWAAAGHPHTVFPTSFAELLRLTGGVAAEVEEKATAG
ncbi:YbaK/EbsC family protein [Streptosporangium sandarakinum]|uniref:Prolyl-tRNA editing enzyme YbaK/EbsC (Cys-tRNA(Pro) deacylase) n=1 Tax=Streptosporangium sandarakinum TaxID=1260955 RepID=A0A852US02_9ACTN|nr:YbaK/EbsC family protein [Streptosporangium sandarakinum]NYF38780.1 prolyl-tRNA editing enzyme YbaK/EbsC (Cys-tRNA(Pro) deacylase) [Streptosporangium sandarakinum]